MLSVVIPTLNAGADLGACLAALDGADEIVVVDGGSSDDSVAIAAASGRARHRGAARARRAAARRGGGGARRLAAVPPRRHAARRRLARGGRRAYRRSARTRPAISRCASTTRHGRRGSSSAGWRRGSRLLGLPYGDQGLLVSRRLYDEVGGFRPLALMEDVDLARRLGRRRLRPLAATALTSAERWRRDGWLRRSARNLGCLALVRRGRVARRGWRASTAERQSTRAHTASSFASSAGSRASGAVMIALSSTVSIGEGARSGGSKAARRDDEVARRPRHWPSAGR